MSEIIMIRHGQASFGGESYDRLSETGRRQMEVSASFFYKKGYSFDHAFSGTLHRQRSSASEFASYYEKMNSSFPEIMVIEGLNEHKSEEIIRAMLPFIIKEEPSLAAEAEKLMTSRKSFQRVYEKSLLRWVSGMDTIPDLQSWEDFKSGVREALQRVMAEAGRGSMSIIFTSGGVIAAALQLVLAIPDDKGIGLSWHIANASVTRFKFNNDSLSLTSFNCFAHLENTEVSLLTYR